FGPGRRCGVTVALEAFFTVLVARVNLDKTDIQPRVFVRRERQLTRDVDSADDLFGLDVVDNPMSAADQDAVAGARHLSAVPGRRRGPGSAGGGANEGR